MPALATFATLVLTACKSLQELTAHINERFGNFVTELVVRLQATNDRLDAMEGALEEASSTIAALTDKVAALSEELTADKAARGATTTAADKPPANILPPYVLPTERSENPDGKSSADTKASLCIDLPATGDKSLLVTAINDVIDLSKLASLVQLVLNYLLVNPGKLPWHIFRHFTLDAKKVMMNFHVLIAKKKEYEHLKGKDTGDSVVLFELIHLYFQSFGLTVVEALAQAKPLVIALGDTEIIVQMRLRSLLAEIKLLLYSVRHAEIIKSDATRTLLKHLLKLLPKPVSDRACFLLGVPFASGNPEPKTPLSYEIICDAIQTSLDQIWCEATEANKWAEVFLTAKKAEPSAAAPFPTSPAGRSRRGAASSSPANSTPANGGAGAASPSTSTPASTSTTAATPGKREHGCGNCRVDSGPPHAKRDCKAPCAFYKMEGQPNSTLKCTNGRKCPLGPKVAGKHHDLYEPPIKPTA